MPSTNPGSASANVGLTGFPALLVQRALISPSDLALAQSHVIQQKIELADAVVGLGVSERESYKALAAAAGVEMVALDDLGQSALAVRLVPEKLARRHSVVPLQVDNRTLTYATCRPFNAEAETDLGFACGRRTALKVATRSSIVAALAVCYPKAESADVAPVRARAGAPVAQAASVSGASPSAAIEMCHHIISRALAAGASDIRIDSGAEGAKLRGRVGTAWQPLLTLPVEVVEHIRDRFKIMARVGTAVRNRSQNGAFKITASGRLTDVRFSTTPTVNGETIMMRLIDCERAATAAAVAQTTRRGPPRVLITDDEPITRLLVKVLLERERYEVLEASNGREGVDIATRERPNLVLIDLNMPVMDGYEAIGRLRREFPQPVLPIIVLTANDGQSVERRVLELGADDYIIKPFEPPVLLSRVNAVFRRLSVSA